MILCSVTQGDYLTYLLGILNISKEIRDTKSSLIRKQDGAPWRSDRILKQFEYRRWHSRRSSGHRSPSGKLQKRLRLADQLQRGPLCSQIDDLQPGNALQVRSGQLDRRNPLASGAGHKLPEVPGNRPGIDGVGGCLGVSEGAHQEQLAIQQSEDLILQRGDCDDRLVLEIGQDRIALVLEPLPVAFEQAV